MVINRYQFNACWPTDSTAVSNSQLSPKRPQWNSKQIAFASLQPGSPRLGTSSKVQYAIATCTCTIIQSHVYVYPRMIRFVNMILDEFKISYWTTTLQQPCYFNSCLTCQQNVPVWRLKLDHKKVTSPLTSGSIWPLNECCRQCVYIYSLYECNTREHYQRHSHTCSN